MKLIPKYSYEFNQILNETKYALTDPTYSNNYDGYGSGVEAKHVYLDDKIKSIYPKLYEIYEIILNRRKVLMYDNQKESSGEKTSIFA